MLSIEYIKRSNVLFFNYKVKALKNAKKFKSDIQFYIIKRKDMNMFISSKIPEVIIDKIYNYIPIFLKKDRRLYKISKKKDYKELKYDELNDDYNYDYH